MCMIVAAPTYMCLITCMCCCRRGIPLKAVVANCEAKWFLQELQVRSALYLNALLLLSGQSASAHAQGSSLSCGSSPWLLVEHGCSPWPCLVMVSCCEQSPDILPANGLLITAPDSFCPAILPGGLAICSTWVCCPLQLAMSGDHAAMVRVSHMLLVGYGTRQDEAAAANWTRKAW